MLDRLAHFTINVSHIAGKHLALTDYLSRNPSAPPQADDAYDEEYVINNIVPHYKFVAKYGCLSNHFNQSHDATRISESKHSKTRERTAIACLNRPPESCINLIANSNNLTMDARTIDNLEAADPSAETRQLIARWRDIVKPGIHRQSGGRWKKYHEPKFLRNERKTIEERLQLAIQNLPGQQQQQQQPQGFQPQQRLNEQWIVDPFWGLDRPQRPQEQPATSSPVTMYAPMEEGKHRSGPIRPRSPGHQLGQIRGRQKRPLHKDGSRSQSRR